MNIVLIGLPGSGKTTLGRLLAQRLGRPFVDLDADIEAADGRAIPRIFAEDGEAGFRALEAGAVAVAARQDGLVLATGGGTVLRAENATALRENGFVVFVDRPPSVIAINIETAHRPLLKDGPTALEALAAARRPTYLACAHWVLPNSGSLNDTLELLAAAVSPLDVGDYCVIGDPISHSLSPAIHAAAFAAQGLSAGYGAVRVPAAGLGGFIAGAKAAGLRGFNVTAPHKQAILPYLDHIEPEAALAGAVNTVALRDGRLHGANTDMAGLLLALERAGSGYAGRRVLVLGVGGAGRATALKALLEGAKQVHLAARNPERAAMVARQVAAATGGTATANGFGTKQLAGAAQTADLLINTTPLGMAGTGADFEDLAFLEALPKATLVCDLIYSPAETALLKRAKALGCPVLNGLGMLIFQALLAQQYFLGKPLDLQGLYKTVSDALPKSRKELAS